MWVSSPTADFATCADQAYMTIDLGSSHTTTGATIWHYYGNDRAYCSQKIALSGTGLFAGEETVVFDTGSCSGWCTFPIACTNAEAGDCTPDNYGPTESPDGNAFTWAPTQGRFLRHWSGRGQNSGVHFMEIDVYGCAGESCAYDICETTCPISINLDQLDGVTAIGGPGVDTRGNPNTVIDMDHTPALWTSSPTGGFSTCADSLYMTIDLGTPHTTTGATIWHYYGNDRAYCSQKLALSVAGLFVGEETVVFDTGSCSGWCTFPITCTNAEAGDCTPDNYGPTESPDGNAFTWAPTPGRYLRHWSGRGQNSGVHFMEIDVYGCAGESCDPVGGR
jgi:hypothetical protein